MPTAQLLPVLRLATAGAAEDVRLGARDLLSTRLRGTGMFEDCPWEPGLWLAALPRHRAADPDRPAEETTRCADARASSPSRRQFYSHTPALNVFTQPVAPPECG